MTDAHLERDTVALFTPVPNGGVLAALLGLNKIPARVIETGNGTLAVLDSDEEGAGASAAAAVATLLKDNPTLVMERRAGQLTVHRHRGSLADDEVPPGLALDSAPHVVQKLMSGATSIEDVEAESPETVFPTPRGRFKAFRQLRRYAKQAKREQSERR